MKEFFGSEKWLQAAAFALRYEVFVLEQQIEPQLEFDALDDHTRSYYVAFIDQKPVATIRYQTSTATTLQPDRLCVAKNFRKQGLGTRALLTIEAKGRAAGLTHAQLVAEVSAQVFYERLGYHKTSSPYLADGILCITMQKQLSD